MLTFDYEIGFGQNFATWDQILFEPAEQIASLLEQTGSKGTFFVDALCLPAFQALERTTAQGEFVDQFQSQVAQFAKRGHEIQTHIHAHWKGSEYNFDEGQWDFNLKAFSFGDVVENYGLEEAQSQFGAAHTLLTDLSGVQPIAYRAGGYSVLLHQEQLIQTLLQHGYRYDTSVLPYKKRISDIHKFDFMNVPDLGHWRTRGDSLIALSHEESALIELPIVSLRDQGLYTVLDRAFKAAKRLIPGASKLRASLDHNPTMTGARAAGGETENRSLTFNFDLVTPYDVPRMLWLTEAWARRHAKTGTSGVLTILAHPKGMRQASLDAMSSYIRSAQKRWGAEFVGYRDLETSDFSFQEA